MPFEYDQGAIDRMLREVDNRMVESGRRAVAIAQQLVPVRSGYLRSTIGFTYNLNERVLRIHADAAYAAVVEEGSIYQRAQPYLRPALNAIGSMWLGGTQIEYMNAFHRSNSPPNLAVVAYNRRQTDYEHQGASRHAHVRYRRGRSHIGSRFSPTRPNRAWLNAPSPNDPTTPIL